MTQLTIEDALHHYRNLDFEKSHWVCIELLKQNPDNYSAWSLRGNIFLTQYKPFDALTCFDRILMCKNDEWPAWNNKAIAHVNLDQHEMAEICFRKSLEQYESYEANVGMCNLFSLQMKLEQSLEYAEKALTFHKYDPSVLFTKSILLLGLGRWSEGYPLHKHRWDTKSLSVREKLKYPDWKGEYGKTVLLYAEQGYGDEILGFKFIKPCLDQGINVILQVRPPFARLARTLGVPFTIMGDPFPDGIDAALPLLDVPGVLGLNWKMIDRDPYIKIQEHMTHKMPFNGLNVGICWKTGAHQSPHGIVRRHKSLKPDDFRPLIMDGVNLISLQKEAENVPDDFPLRDFTDGIHDFYDTAALINQLDLVVTVDTAVAHLAGAMGKPVWNLVRFDGYWPWMDPNQLPSQDHCIWYESMKLFRQVKSFDWSVPLKQITQALKQLKKEQNDGVSIRSNGPWRGSFASGTHG